MGKDVHLSYCILDFSLPFKAFLSICVVVYLHRMDHSGHTASSSILHLHVLRLLYLKLGGLGSTEQ